VLDRLARTIYERLGHRYRLIFLLTEEIGALLVATMAVYLIASYYEPSTADLMFLLVAGWIFTMVAVGWALWRGTPYLARVVAWQQNPSPTVAESTAAWDAATNFPIRSFRANSLTVGSIAALPVIVLLQVRLDLPWTAVPVLLAAILAPVAYATVLNYFVAEVIMRPVVEDIADELPDDFRFEPNGLLIRKRLKILLPVFTTWVGFVAVALMTGTGGTRTLAMSVLAAFVVGMAFSFELTVLLSRSVTQPIAALRRGVASVRDGNYDARVPVVTSDELGELSHDFNLMAAGLEEREQMREAFGTYLDRDIVQLILSGRFPQDGVEVTVSIMFVDVRGFTAFAEQSEPTEVVGELNRMFEVMVPIVAKHGGHVDKFLGDGLLAVFGTPEGWDDHADRAVAAGQEIVRSVNRPDATLRVGVGINTGPVVAGSIGGAGRLNFSVIGDAVNVSARVEAATRDTGDDLLITQATREALRNPLELESRGTVALKGKAEPVEVLACVVDETATPEAAEASAQL
jgi:adenylate cyclase